MTNGGRVLVYPRYLFKRIVYPDPNLSFYGHKHCTLVKKKKIFVTAPLFALLCIGGDRLKITGEMVCAGVEGEPLGGCHGDSGGPYVCQSSSGNWFLQGAVSWGSPRCAASERYTVFARVAQFRNWIRQHTGV